MYQWPQLINSKTAVSSYKKKRKHVDVVFKKVTRRENTTAKAVRDHLKHKEKPEEFNYDSVDTGARQRKL